MVVVSQSSIKLYYTHILNTFYLTLFYMVAKLLIQTLSGTRYDANNLSRAAL